MFAARNDEPADVPANMGWSHAPACYSQAQAALDWKTNIFTHYPW